MKILITLAAILIGVFSTTPILALSDEASIITPSIATDRIIAVGDSITVPISIDGLTNGLSGFTLALESSNAALIEIVSANVDSTNFPLATIEITPTQALISAVDLLNNISKNATSTHLVDVILVANTLGEPWISLDITRVDDDDGFPIPIKTDAGMVVRVSELDHCIREWIWNTDDPKDIYWNGPDDSLGVLDLRTIPEMSSFGLSTGLGFFSYATPPVGDFFCFGADIDSKVSLSSIIAIESVLKLSKPLESQTIRNILFELFTQHGDITGATAWKPLIPNREGVLTMGIKGHTIIKSEKFEIDKHSKSLALLQHDFAKARAKLEPRGSVKHLQLLSTIVAKTGIPYAIITGSSEIKPVIPATRVGDTFDGTNGTDLDAHTPTASTSTPAGSGWTHLQSTAEIVNDTEAEVSTQNTEGIFRLDSAVSSTDHFCEADVTTNNEARNYDATVFCRKDSSATLTMHEGRLQIAQSVGDHMEIFKRVGGATTELAASPNDEFIFNDGFFYTINLDINGTSLELFRDEVSKASTTDASISAGTFGGLVLDDDGGSPAEARAEYFIIDDGIPDVEGRERQPSLITFDPHRNKPEISYEIAT